MTLHAVAEKLEVVNHQLAFGTERRRAALIACGAVFAATALALLCFAVMGDEYLAWDLDDPETAVVATMLHGFSWFFIRLSPVLLAASAAGFLLAWQRGWCRWVLPVRRMVRRSWRAAPCGML